MIISQDTPDALSVESAADDVETRHVVAWQPTFKFTLSGAILKPDFISKLT